MLGGLSRIRNQGHDVSTKKLKRFYEDLGNLEKKN